MFPMKQPCVPLDDFTHILLERLTDEGRAGSWAHVNDRASRGEECRLFHQVAMVIKDKGLLVNQPKPVPAMKVNPLPPKATPSHPAIQKQKLHHRQPRFFAFLINNVASSTGCSFFTRGEIEPAVGHSNCCRREERMAT